MTTTLRLLLVIALTAMAPAFAATPTPPAQPAHGPGGADYAHAQVIAREVKSGAQGWWLFTPAAPVPTSAPVMVFCHGWGALDPKNYRAWIDHIVRRGNILVWPNYQASLLTPGGDFLPNAIAGIRAALADLQQNPSKIRPELDHVAILGHSAGAVLSAEIAAAAKSAGLPEFRAVMPVEPGDGSQDGHKRVTVPHTDLSPMPASTKLLVVVGAEDHRAYESLGLSFYADTRLVPATDKNVIELQSDHHGSPPLLANHAAPGGSLDARPPRRALIPEFEHAGTVDALDWYGHWKLFDALSDCAFHNRECATALGGGPAQTDMGAWSDGVPVKPMRVLR
jgi:acetyl esterase/lipase